MTIEIKQLVVRAVVEERRERAPTAAPVPRRAGKPAAELDRESLIAECVRRVMRELRKGRGR